MRGILSWGGYLPHRRLDRRAIAGIAGKGGGGGTRTVASYDEDAVTLGVAAARLALRHAPAAPASLWFATTDPPYLDKTNATTVHAALRLDRETPAYDAVGSVRSAAGALRAALASDGPALVVAGDLRGGLPGGADEAAGGDGGSALLVGGADAGPVLAELCAVASATEEFTDRWRVPGEAASRLWEERFGETRYTALGVEAVKVALGRAGVAAAEVGALAVAGLHARASAAVAARSGVPAEHVVDRLEGTVGVTGAAHPGLLLASALEDAASAPAGRVIVLLVLSDGADAFVFRTTGALAAHHVADAVAAQAARGVSVDYGTYLAWRGMLPVEPPRRPEPARPSSSAAARNAAWKYGFTGSRGDDGVVRMPPSPLDATPALMADARGTIVTFTVDRLAYSPSPPVVFAVVDFDGGGRLPIELTDVAPDDVAIGGRVEPVFRRLFTADGIHNYFWKARPVRDGEG
ncbi:OB-fold domain-containing protein [Actinocorallia sp. A-T 12471]|uniref:OB-fold domain-containing protein n=1 Tax=Actinocorallia sp. A-T 12471 TaxID=3089813 RepID=UPI0029CDC4F1|nr:OB-fold domain-containing protein [Actinocorallia sp. A-T 12471]MDX6740943.1 OB-fold domain-containing protein [Actinocorallia sp. A-T 12471]